MSIIDLKTAVREIRQGCGPHVDDGFRPFFFIVGSGISSPPIPLAAGISEHCQAKALLDGLSKDEKQRSAIDTYSYWFDCAYPHAAERRTYLHELIHNKPISPANLRLAHILESGQLADIVVTPNFDDLLARGLTLFGKYFTQCDHPQMAARIDPERRDAVQIVHVHGTYWFYDCCNLRDEVLTRSVLSSNTTATMANLLDRILAKRSPLVVGYSGWEEDAIMSALRRRLEGQSFAYRLYWFCHRFASYEALPSWLRNHPDARFIVPASVNNKQPSDDTDPHAAKPLSAKQAIDDGSNATLSAQEVMDAIIQGFSLSAPKLTSDPLAFYADLLKSSVVHDEDDTPEDLYGINGVISRISHANSLEKQQREANEDSLEQIRDSLRRSAYQEVIDRAIAIDASHLDRQQCETLAQALNDVLKPNLIQKPMRNIIEGCDLMMRLATELLGNTSSSKHLNTIGNALYCKGYYTLAVLDKADEAFALFTDLVKRFDGIPSVRRFAAVGQYFIGSVHKSKGEIDKAMAAYDKVIDDFSAPGTLGRDMAVWAMLRKIEILCNREQVEEARALLNQAQSIISGSSDTLITTLLPQANLVANVVFNAEKTSEAEKSKNVHEDPEERLPNETKDVTSGPE